MNEVVKQFKRLFTDDGRADKDFSQKENEVRQAKANLDAAIARFKKAADDLYDAFLLEAE